MSDASQLAPEPIAPQVEPEVTFAGRIAALEHMVASLIHHVEGRLGVKVPPPPAPAAAPTSEPETN